MALRLNDIETEKLVLARGLLDKAALEQYYVRIAEDPSFTLFDLLVAERVIPVEVLAELEHSVPGGGHVRHMPGDTAAEQGQVMRTTPASGLSRPGSTLRKGPRPPSREFDAPAPARPPVSASPPAPVALPPRPVTLGARPGAPAPVSLGAPGAPAPVAAPPAGAPPRPVLPPRLNLKLGTPGAPPTAQPAPSAPAAAPPRAGAPSPVRLQLRPGNAPPPEPAPASAPPAAPAALQVPAPAAPAPASIAPPPAPEHDSHGGGHDSHGGPAETIIPEGWPGGIAPEDPSPSGIQAYLKAARAMGASDFHLAVNIPPMIRIHGKLQLMQEGMPAMTPAQTQALIRMALTPEQWAYFDRTGDLDFCYAFPNAGRFRTNVFRDRTGDGMVCRIIGETIQAIETLGLPPGVKRLTEFAQGLVLVTGPSGHGKTTTMISLVDLVNANRPDHIITVEAPIEYLLEGKQCQVTQREVGPHTASFAAALKAALREDPDIIMIGELRDYETTSMAINAAETGHLVFASLPTQDAAKTIDKVLDSFPPEEQQQIRMMVSESLRGIISQQLIPRKDGQGRVAACELLFNNVAVGNIIREANTAGLVNAMQLGKNLGMVLMDDSLMALAEQDLIDGSEAYKRAGNKQKFMKWAPKAEPPAAKPAAGAAPAAGAKPAAGAPPPRPGLGRR
ncbi:MAG: hypothetical protein AMXMBFR7_28220 [Planctomycetota bacterium]